MEDLRRLANLIRKKTELEAEITGIIGRPAQIGHVGEFIASRVFHITLTPSATERGYDGHFREGPLKGASVNIKWYARQEGLLDIDMSRRANFYLVLAGPHGYGPKGDPRPWLIKSVYLFDAPRLAAALTTRGVKMGIATSVKKADWEAAEIYPQPQNPLLQLSDEQRELLALFG